VQRLNKNKHCWVDIYNSSYHLGKVTVELHRKHCYRFHDETVFYLKNDADKFVRIFEKSHLN